ncbi:MAG: M20/M25/M40 family metallo-hydrolase [Nitrospinae bacterium]|nr:M20/M25/M40 family metallo-hydrolase [Nitrospinota bacterium]
MGPNELEREARGKVRNESPLVFRHMEHMRRLVGIDSRSFNVGEFEGDRKTPSDMREILQAAEAYLRDAGFGYVKINEPPPSLGRATPVLLAEIHAGKDKPTALLYAHLDKQPYMDDAKFEKWDGVPPWVMRWNEDRTRAYGRGAADDLSGVVAIGMAADALLQACGFDPKNPSPADLENLPCNIKVIYETEEEAGSHSLVEQILQNREFFSGSDFVIITDVINPAQGVPALTASLRGIILVETVVKAETVPGRIDAQTALYKLLSSLIREDHSLAIEGIARSDIPLTDQERQGYAQVPTSAESLREAAGLLPETRLVVPPDKAAILAAQLRKSYVSARPGHRVAGSVVFGASGARLAFRLRKGVEPGVFRTRLQETLARSNRFQLKLRVTETPSPEPGFAAFDLFLQAADKDPHSGVIGGPFPVAELQLARMIDLLVGDGGGLRDPELQDFLDAKQPGPAVSVRSLRVDHDGSSRPFADASAKAMVEVRLAPGNDERRALEFLKNHLQENKLPGFALEFKEEKGASPWMTDLNHPAFPLMLEALKAGYSGGDIPGAETVPCLYGCGGSIPFVPKLTGALGAIPPLCIGAYDPDSRMHEPNESLSMADLLGCARSIVYFLAHSGRAFPK